MINFAKPEPPDDEPEETPSKRQPSLDDLDSFATELGAPPMRDLGAEAATIGLIVTGDQRLRQTVLYSLTAGDFHVRANRDAFQLAFTMAGKDPAFTPTQFVQAWRDAGHADQSPGAAELFATPPKGKTALQIVSAVLRHSMRRQVEELAIPLLSSAETDGDVPTAMHDAIFKLNLLLRRWISATSSLIGV